MCRTPHKAVRMTNRAVLARSPEGEAQKKNLLQRIGPKGQAAIEDLGSASHVGSLNRELDDQVATVVGVRQWNPQNRQNVFRQSDVAA